MPREQEAGLVVLQLLCPMPTVGGPDWPSKAEGFGYFWLSLLTTDPEHKQAVAVQMYYSD